MEDDFKSIPMKYDGSNGIKLLLYPQFTLVDTITLMLCCIIWYGSIYI